MQIHRVASGHTCCTLFSASRFFVFFAECASFDRHQHHQCIRIHHSRCTSALWICRHTWRRWEAALSTFQRVHVVESVHGRGPQAPHGGVELHHAKLGRSKGKQERIALLCERLLPRQCHQSFDASMQRPRSHQLHARARRSRTFGRRRIFQHVVHFQHVRFRQHEVRRRACAVSSRCDGEVGTHCHVYRRGCLRLLEHREAHARSFRLLLNVSTRVCDDATSTDVSLRRWMERPTVAMDHPTT
mmetsp:Transcript_4024/g.25278  ORF Transcript_4024/g.25278 Transcript_4024/m.25278 type:complete len:244 (-) Transcript_4024:511-1242(-)